MAVAPDGSKVFVTGRSRVPTTGDDYATVAYEATSGAVVWGRRYSGPGEEDDIPASIVASPDGTMVFVTGYTTRPTTLEDFATVAYNAATGATIWAKVYDGPAHSDDRASSVATSPDGSKVYVTGYSHGATSNKDFATVAYDAATGAQLWGARYDRRDGYDEAVGVAASADGTKVFVAGSVSVSTSKGDYATVAYDADTGSVLWGRTYNGPADSSDYAYSIAASPDGSNLFVTGGSFGPSQSDYATVAYDASSGTQSWVARYNGPGNGSDIAASIAASPDGSKVIVTGTSVGATTGSDYATLAYDAAGGTQLWEARYPTTGGSTDEAKSLAISPDGSKVFVTGLTGTIGSFDYGTVAFDASTGTLLWGARYNGPDDMDDWAFAVRVSPDGTKVFVTGLSFGAATRDDWATVAYEA
jgi:hypothetical protein